MRLYIGTYFKILSFFCCLFPPSCLFSFQFWTHMAAIVVTWRRERDMRFLVTSQTALTEFNLPSSFLHSQFWSCCQLLRLKGSDFVHWPVSACPPSTFQLFLSHSCGFKKKKNHFTIVLVEFWEGTKLELFIQTFECLTQLSGAYSNWVIE